MVLFLFSSTPNLQIRILLQGSLKLFAGIIMIIMGVNMLGIFQGLRGCLKNHSSKLQKISKMHKIQTSFLHKKISGGRKTPFITDDVSGRRNIKKSNGKLGK